MSQDKQGPSLESFFSSISDANRKLMEQFVGNFAGMKLPDGELNPFVSMWGAAAKSASQLVEMQTNLYQQQMNLWMNFLGQKVPEVASPDPSDKRFAAAEWNDHPFFNLLKQNYLFASKWLTEMVHELLHQAVSGCAEPDQLCHDQPGSAQARHRNQG